jgi:hypothetical protein
MEKGSYLRRVMAERGSSCQGYMAYMTYHRKILESHALLLVVVAVAAGRNYLNFASRARRVGKRHWIHDERYQ